MSIKELKFKLGIKNNRPSVLLIVVWFWKISSRGVTDKAKFSNSKIRIV